MLLKTFRLLAPPPRKHDFSTENKHKLPFSNPLPPTSSYVIYEWSPPGKKIKS